MKNEPEIVETILTLLRQYGWQTGLKKLRQETAAADDKQKQEALQFFAGWMAAERGAYEEAITQFENCARIESLAGWATFGLAFLEMRRHDFHRAHQLLDGAKDRAETGSDEVLQAAIDHLRGSLLHHQGDSDRALSHLRRALKLFGKDHFGTGRVLDTFGMVYAAKDNFHAAEEFYKQAVALKRKFNDQAGLAVTHGNLGRLYLDWGYLDKAEESFLEDLRLAQSALDDRGEAQMHNHLGQVALARGEREAAAGRAQNARPFWKDAGAYLDASIGAAKKRNWPILEGYARKDRALVDLAEGNVVEAGNQAQAAEELFRAGSFAEGMAHVSRLWGIIRREQARFEEANRALRAALNHFEETSEEAEVARTKLEIARSQRAAKGPRPLIKQMYVDALKTAEACRRFELIRQIEEELKAVDFEAYCVHVFHRVRGRDVTKDTTSLITGELKPASVLYLDLKGSTNFALGRSPEEVMMILNQMMADFVSVLRKHAAQVSAFRGDGFLALFLGANHAVRAVAAALDLFQELSAFNEPRKVLEIEPFEARIGIASGDVFLGNVGTYDKMDYTAIGTTANLGARLESNALAHMPCISWQTHDLVRDRFRYAEASPRTVDLKGLGPTQMWDVAGWAHGSSGAR